MGLTEAEWQHLSMQIRLEHESTHYFTRRVFGSMRNNLLDELMAGYRGIVAAIGHYRADWFLRLLGLENPDYHGGRLEKYRGQPPLSAGAFQVLCDAVKAAAENLERFDTTYAKHLKTPDEQVLILITLSKLTLLELASEQAHILLQKMFKEGLEARG